MNTKRGFAAIIPVVAVGILLLVAGGYYFLVQNGKLPFPTLTTQLNKNWKEYSSDRCGTSHPKTNFSISIPNNWNATIREDQFWAEHAISGTSGEKLILICGDGFGGGCDPGDKKEIRLGNETQLGCYSEREGRVHLSQVGVVSDEVGVTIEADFPAGVSSKETLNQILSTFKFVD